MKYFFDQDESSHWYMIPSIWREEWNRLNELEDGWDTPEWAKFEGCRTHGGIGHIEFENPSKL